MTHVGRQIQAQNVGFKILEHHPNQRGKTNPNLEQGNAQDATKIVSKLNFKMCENDSDCHYVES